MEPKFKVNPGTICKWCSRKDTDTCPDRDYSVHTVFCSSFKKIEVTGGK